MNTYGNRNTPLAFNYPQRRLCEVKITKGSSVWLILHKQNPQFARMYINMYRDRFILATNMLYTFKNTL